MNTQFMNVGGSSGGTGSQSPLMAIVHTADTDKSRQFCLVCVVVVNKP